MCSPHSALSGLPGPGVEVMGAHFSAVGLGPGVGAGPAAGVLAFTGVGPGTLPLAIAGIASLAAGAAATLWGRDSTKTRRRLPKGDRALALPDLSHLAESAAA